MTFDAQALHRAPDAQIVLLGQDLGRGHHGGLMAVADGDQERGHRHNRLARADVALHQPVHGPDRLHVLRHLADDAGLGAGQGVRQDGF